MFAMKFFALGFVIKLLLLLAVALIWVPCNGLGKREEDRTLYIEHHQNEISRFGSIITSIGDESQQQQKQEDDGDKDTAAIHLPFGSFNPKTAIYNTGETLVTPLSDTITTTTRKGDHHLPTNQIPLWPNNKVPYEHPNVFGKNESIISCIDKDCTDRRVWNVTIPTLLPYLVPSSDAAMIVAPGGGYSLLAIDREGINIARWLNSIGISAFVLKYRVPARSWLSFGGAPLMDAQRAMGIVRTMATTTSSSSSSRRHPSLLPNLNPSKIGFMGFSAGGHLTGHINVQYTNRTYPPLPDDEADQQSCRPDFSIMIYPWRSVSQPPVNEPISGASAQNVTHNTPPTLLIQTQDDPVHVENSIYYYLALKSMAVSPSELHVYPQGGHGYGDCTAPGWRHNDYDVCSWTDRAKDFLKTLGVLVKTVVKEEKEEEESDMQR